MRPTRALMVLFLMAFTLSGCSAGNVIQNITSPIKKSVSFVVNLVPFVGKGDGKAPKAAEEAPERAAPQERPKIVGTVRFTHDSFVLIYSPTNSRIAPGTPLVSVDKSGEYQNSKLKMSAEKKGSFLVADIVSGKPKSGDLVMTSPKSASKKSGSSYQMLP